MDKIRFLAKDETIYDATLSYVSDHVMSLKLTQSVVKDIYTSGFDLINEYNGSVMASYEDYTTEYRKLETGEIQLSNDGSIYVPPAPETKSVLVSITWDDSDDADKIRPNSVNVVLYGDGSKVASKKLNANMEWQFEFEDLDASKEYVAKFDEVKGYTINGTNTVVYSHTPIARVKYDKKNEFDQKCSAIIYSGLEIALSDTHIEHFTFTDHTQANITSAYNTANALAAKGKKDILIPFYNGDNVGELYKPEDIYIIYYSMYELINTTVALDNQLHLQIDEMTDADKIKELVFEVDSLDKVHKAKYNEIIAGVQAVINALKG